MNDSCAVNGKWQNVTKKFPFGKFFLEYNAWEYIPMDQGGRLIQLALIGSEDDRKIVKTVSHQDFFNVWGNPVNWRSLERSELEKSVWLSRWYFLLSFARLFLIDGDRRHLEFILDFIRRWDKDNPVPADYAAAESCGYVWKDMQVAWRTYALVFIWGLCREGMTFSEQEYLAGVLAGHARILGEFFGPQKLSTGNHQSHGACAMLLAGTLHPWLESADFLHRRGLEILEHHLSHAFYDDGNSVELSPGYYPYIASIFRDAYLVCRENGIALSDLWTSRLRQFHAFITQVAQPDQTMPPINDSTEIPVNASIRILAELLGLKNAEIKPESTHFKSSAQAVMRSGKESGNYVFLDAGAKMLWHWHCGKLGFHLWWNSTPLLVDGGVSNYDDPMREIWCTAADAHNTIIVDGDGDYRRDRIDFSRLPEAACSMPGWESRNNFAWALMHSMIDSNDDKVEWLRHFMMIKDRFLLVVDWLSGGNEHTFRWLFHGASGARLRDISGGTAWLENGCQGLLIKEFIQPDDSMPQVPSFYPQGLVAVNGRMENAPLLRFHRKGRTALSAFLLLPVPSGIDTPTVTMAMERDAEHALVLNVTLDGETHRVKIDDALLGGKNRQLKPEYSTVKL